jgi:DNA-binding protein WhiA
LAVKLMAKEPSFCVQVKNEVAHQAEARSCCLRAELAACARTLGSMRIASGAAGSSTPAPGGRPQDPAAPLASAGAALLFTSENPVVARRIFKLARQLGWQADILVRLCTRPRQRRLFVVQTPLRQQGLFLLQELGLADRKGRLKDRLEGRLLDRNCCRRAYLRGCFLGGGFLNQPGHGYHLEFVFENSEAAEELKEILTQFGLNPSRRKRKENCLVYLKEADRVGEFLRLVGATQGVLAFENGRIMKDMRNQVNRLVNCETANVGKEVDAGLSQVEMIGQIQRRAGLESLSPQLRALALLRLSHPEASLQELGRLLDPPLGKSGVNHRFRQLRLIAGQLRSEKRAGARLRARKCEY